MPLQGKKKKLMDETYGGGSRPHRARVRRAWDDQFKGFPTKPLVLMFTVGGMTYKQAAAKTGEYFAIGVYVAHPQSRGSIHITVPSIDDKLDFVTGFLSDEHENDIKFRFYTHCILPSRTRRQSAVAETQYAPEDDAPIEKWVREHVTACWQGLGTCKMAPEENMGVVDENLSVYGVQELKIADLGIAPVNVSANRMNTALVIGEKAADIFTRDWVCSRARPRHDDAMRSPVQYLSVVLEFDACPDSTCCYV
ncbi:Uu.00g143800.m01.CDS01 [Anthostomella pinea]|uniref:Uu.00g143800.m01.CDS01 n=1 Tax=Anthostomella pinea TaxID=933095 RepID=A0AAI8VRE0_9PEZI|nr:Uu.00g143800.m01.CDS01 [Anthostomella pinea]